MDRQGLDLKLKEILGWLYFDAEDCQLVDATLKTAAELAASHKCPKNRPCHCAGAIALALDSLLPHGGAR